MTFADKVVYLRKRNNLTQQELADKLHTSKQAVSKYERGVVTNLPLVKLQELADALNTTPGYLMGWEEEPKKEEVPTISDEDKKFIELLHLLDPDKKEKLLALLEVLANS